MLLPKTPFSKGNHFGIALTQTSLRAIKADSEGAVLAEVEEILEKPLIVGNELDQEVLRQGLIALMSKAQFGLKYAAICIPEKYAFSREHVFHDIELGEISEAIQWQIDKIFPFSAQEIYSDWKLIEKDEHEIKVLITVIPKKLLESLKNAIQSAKIFPISFEPSATALLRLLPDGSGKGLHMILELNERDASATLVVDGVSTLTTTALFVADQGQEQMVQQLVTIVTNLYEYLDKIKRRGEELTLWVTGEQVLPEVVTLVSAQLGFEAKLLEFKNVSPKNHLAYSVGAVDVMPSSSEKTINLLPTALQEYYNAIVTFDYSKIVIRLVSIFIFVSVLLSVGAYGLASYLVISTKRERDLAQAAQLEIGPQEINIAEVSKNVSRLTTLFPLKQSPERFISAVYELTPKEIELKQVAYTDASKRITMLGLAQSREIILQYKEVIESSDVFERVALPLSTFELSEDIPFTMEFFVTKEAL